MSTQTSDFYCAEVLSERTRVRKVKETPGALAFHHTRPSFQTHIVVVPKRHVSSLIDSTWLTSEQNELLDLLRTVAGEVLAAHGACRVVTNLGAYQDSKHLHWHVVSGERVESGLPWP